jgi:hypothetical protein
MCSRRPPCASGWEQDIDAASRIVSSFVRSREITVARVRGVLARALERELDAISLARATAPDPAQLRDGTVTRRIGIEWVCPQGRQAQLGCRRC